MIPNAVYVDGKVVVQYYQPVPKYIKTPVGEVVFDCQHGISLAFVDEPLANSLIQYQGGCCGGKRFVVSLASEVIYQHWLHGNGGRN